MDLDKKYTLLESIPGHGATSFCGRQLASGREVTVHLLGGKPEERETLLSRIRALPPESLSQVVEVGEHEGTLYLVTSAPPHRHFSEWLPDPHSATSSEARIQLKDAAAAAKPGEFTRFFSPGSFAPEPVRPGAEPPQAGEFTRLFGPAVAPGETGPAPGELLDAAQFNPPEATQGPGEYTRIIGHSVTAAARQPDEMPAAQPVHPRTQLAGGSPGRRMASPVVTLVLCLLSFAAGATLVFLILRH